jgi:hypothetical protein
VDQRWPRPRTRMKVKDESGWIKKRVRDSGA